MAVSYKKLWHILVDRNMKKKDLEEAAGITHYQMYKLANDKDITTDVIGAICAALEVEPNDIMDFVPDSNDNQTNYTMAYILLQYNRLEEFFLLYPFCLLV